MSGDSDNDPGDERLVGRLAGEMNALHRFRGNLERQWPPHDAVPLLTEMSGGDVNAARQLLRDATARIQTVPEDLSTRTSDAEQLRAGLLLLVGLGSQPTNSRSVRLRQAQGPLGYKQASLARARAGGRPMGTLLGHFECLAVSLVALVRERGIEIPANVSDRESASTGPIDGAEPLTPRDESDGPTASVTHDAGLEHLMKIGDVAMAQVEARRANRTLEEPSNAPDDNGASKDAVGVDAARDPMVEYLTNLDDAGLAKIEARAKRMLEEPSSTAEAHQPTARREADNDGRADKRRPERQSRIRLPRLPLWLWLIGLLAAILLLIVGQLLR